MHLVFCRNLKLKEEEEIIRGSCHTGVERMGKLTIRKSTMDLKPSRMRT